MISKETYRFGKRLLLLSVLTGTFGMVLWDRLLPPKFHSPHLWFASFYFFVSTILVFHFIIKGNEKGAQYFIRLYIITIMMRMFLGVSVLIIYALAFRSYTMGFALFFLILYLLFLAFEVAALMKFFNQLHSK